MSNKLVPGIKRYNLCRIELSRNSHSEVDSESEFVTYLETDKEDKGMTGHPATSYQEECDSGLQIGDFGPFDIETYEKNSRRCRAAQRGGRDDKMDTHSIV